MQGESKPLVWSEYFLKELIKQDFIISFQLLRKGQQDATNTPRMEAASKGGVQRALNPAEQQSTYTIYS